MACATYFELAPEAASRYLRPARGRTALSYPPSFGTTARRVIRTLQHKGHPHPVLSRSTSGMFRAWLVSPPKLATDCPRKHSLLTELEARLLPVLSPSASPFKRRLSTLPGC